jgi:hypothetical protein|tara:strand:- start:294 stop:650 length:357 start_codon:yes stop_codon:yes gene_type:complete
MLHLIKYAVCVNIAHTLSDICPPCNPLLLCFQSKYTKISKSDVVFTKLILDHKLNTKPNNTNNKAFRKSSRYLLSSQKNGSLNGSSVIKAVRPNGTSTNLKLQRAVQGGCQRPTGSGS